MNKIKITLMIVAIFAIVLIAGSITYYYIFYLPGNERTKQEIEQKKEIELQKQEAENQRKCQECLDKVEKDYKEKMLRAASIVGNLNTHFLSLSAFLYKEYQDKREDCYKLYGK